MPSLEERVAYLEGRLADHASVVTDVQRATPETRALVEDLRTRFDAVGDALNRKIDGVDERLGAKIDAVGDALNRKIDAADDRLGAKIDAVGDALNRKIDGVDGRLGARIDAMDHRLGAKIDAVDQRLGAKIDRHFMWLVGIQIATLVAIIGALLRR